MKHLYLSLGLLFTTILSAQAQFHFKGLQGISVAYGSSSDIGHLYRVGYQTFLSDRFQIEVSTGWGRQSYLDSALSAPYEVVSHYQVDHFLLQETVDYSFLRLFRRLYINLGAGLTQSYQQMTVVGVYPSLDSTLIVPEEEVPAFDAETVRLKDQLNIGGHAEMMMELYLNRYLTLLGRYQYVYLLQSQVRQRQQFSSIGIRFNF